MSAAATSGTIRLSDRVNEMEESATLAMSQKSRELASKGVDVISLSLGEPDFNVPDFVKESGKKAIDDNFSKYMPVPGYQDLRESIAAKFKRDNGLTYTADQIVVSTGAKQSLINLILSTVNPGDEVVVPAPYWVTYYEQVKMAGGIPVVISASVADDFKFTAAQLRKAITPKTKMLIFSNPCNPTGSTYTKAELKEIAGVVAENPGMLAVSDEIYEHIIFSGKHESFAQFPEVYDQTVTVNGLSKGFAMTGYRIGYIAAPKEVAKACVKIQGQYTSGASSIAQRMSKTAVEADPKVIHFMVDAFKKRRDLVLGLLAEIKGVKTNKPEGAFYVFPDISSFFGKSSDGQTIKNADDMAMYLLNNGHVAVVGGDAFGDPNCIRISYATSEDILKKAIARIKTSLEKLA